MIFLSPSRHTRLNEAAGLILSLLGLAVLLSLASYSPADPSWNTATSASHTHNLLGIFGAQWADLFLQVFGASAYLLPLYLWALAWKWVRSSEIESTWIRVLGCLALWFCVSAACGLLQGRMMIGGNLRLSGIVGMVLADYLVARLNLVGAVIATAAAGVLALYLASTFEMSTLMRWLRGPIAKWEALVARWRASRQASRQRAVEKAKARAAERIAQRNAPMNDKDSFVSARPRRASPPLAPTDTEPPFDLATEFVDTETELEEIPIRTLEPQSITRTQPEVEESAAAEAQPVRESRAPAKPNRTYRLPPTELLNEIPLRNGFDGQELKDVAIRIKSKLEEFNVRGSVVQINPGPVVTTFEYKPEAGVKYSRITTLNEDLCLGLQAESILIERLPGKPTVGIEVPNTRRELISLRAILESNEFQESPSKMTISLGKDINGRIKVASLETMPHLLIAGSTGSGKSVMLNAMIMSFLYKATPDEVRMIMVDPKRVELGIYEGIPHLLTPVITEPRKATNALRNAVLEMERRLKLLAAQGVRNIDQYNRRVAQLRGQPRNLFEEDEPEEELKPLP